MKSYDDWLKLLAFSTAFFVIVIFLANFLIDPLQFYRKANYRPVFFENQRLQNPGLAKNYDYDTIILGTSVTENFLPSDINKQLGCKTLKLSASGSTLREQKMMGEVALQTGKVSAVIWGLDFTSARWDPNGVRQGYGPFPYYLYDNNIFNDAKYVFSGSTTKQSLYVLSSILFNRKPNYLETLNNWQRQHRFSSSEVIKDYQKSLNSDFRDLNVFNVRMGYNFENFKSNFDVNVLQIIENNPEVKFILFFPPYSMPFYHYFFTKDNGIIDDWIRCKLYLIDKLADKENVQVFDFQDAYQVSYNLDNYKDMMHYSQDINHYIINEISNKSEKLVKNRQVYLDRLKVFKSNVSSYSI